VAHIAKRPHRSNTERAGASAYSTLRQAEPPVIPLFHDGGEDFRSHAVSRVKVNRAVEFPYPGTHIMNMTGRWQMIHRGRRQY
jgi:hypothetical protein